MNCDKEQLQKCFKVFSNKHVVGDLGIVLVIECILSGFQSKLSRIPNFLKHFLQLATQPWTLPKTCHKGESGYDHQ